MPERFYPYIIVGGGLAGAAAVEGIRQQDVSGPILLISAEHDPPYDRPPLSKKLWTASKRVEEIFLHRRPFYKQNGVELAMMCNVWEKVDAARTLIRNAQPMRIEDLRNAIRLVLYRCTCADGTPEVGTACKCLPSRYRRRHRFDWI